MFFALLLALAAPADWVPARWKSLETKTLELVSGTPINCLLLEWNAVGKTQLPGFAAAATGRSVATLAVIRPGADAVEAARDAMRAKISGIVLEGDFPRGTAGRVRDSLADSKAPVIEITARSAMKLDSSSPIVGTDQGVWPGIQVLKDGAAKAGPSGSPWIDTNSGFLRAAGAFGHTVWLGNLPPPNTVVTGERYLQAIGDAAMSGARWIVALDDDFSRRLYQNEPLALRDWKSITQLLKFYEGHAEWRSFHPAGQLAVVQSAENGALLSGGILDMIGSRHTPVRAVPPQKLTQEALAGASMTVDVDSETLTAEQRDVLRSFTRSGGTLLSAPKGWKSPAPTTPDQITLDEKELKRLDELWHDINAMIGRRNLGARLFNVSTMLSNLLTSADAKEVLVHLVNYASYPVDSVTVHLLGDWKHARLYTPDGKEREIEVYKNDEGTGVDIDLVSVCATLRLD
jgi:hypothetical protein